MVIPPMIAVFATLVDDVILCLARTSERRRYTYAEWGEENQWCNWMGGITIQYPSFPIQIPACGRKAPRRMGEL